MTPSIFRTGDFSSLTKFMIGSLDFCSILGSICYFENSWPINFFIDHCYLFSLNFCSTRWPRYDRFEVYHAFNFCFTSLNPSVLFIFLYADSHSNMGISWIIISAVSVALKKINRSTFSLTMRCTSEKETA